MAISIFHLIGYFILINILTFAAYGYDKASARKNNWRISEKSLHLLALAGGSPAAFFASSYFRHKTKKQPFKSILWLISALQLGLLVTAFTNPGLLHDCCSHIRIIK